VGHRHNDLAVTDGDQMLVLEMEDELTALVLVDPLDLRLAPGETPLGAAAEIGHFALEDPEAAGDFEDGRDGIPVTSLRLADGAADLFALRQRAVDHALLEFTAAHRHA